MTKNERYFIIHTDPEGNWFEEHYDYHLACQEYIDLTDLDDIDCEFSCSDIIKGTVITTNY